MNRPLILSMFLLASSALAQQASAAISEAPFLASPETADGCGPANSDREVKSVDTRLRLGKSDPQKAVVYFIQDDQFFETRPRPTVLWGVDGVWVSGTHGDTYSYVSVEPGEHHICSQWQSGGKYLTGRKSAHAQLNVKAGKTYYLRVQDIYDRNRAIAAIQLIRISSEEAQLLMQRFGFSTSEPKK